MKKNFSKELFVFMIGVVFFVFISSSITAQSSCEEKMFVQYWSTADEYAAELAVRVIESKNYQTEIEKYDSCLFYPEKTTVLIGGQIVNPVFKCLVEQGVFRAITISDGDSPVVQEGFANSLNGSKVKVYGVASWTAQGTINSVYKFYDSLLTCPQQNQPEKFLTLPFEDKEVYISSSWLRTDDGSTWKRGDKHGGIDYSKSGQSFNVFAVADGTVDEVKYDSKSGNYVKIRHDDYLTTDGEPYYSLYFHLATPSNLSKRQNVSQGQKIGDAGNTGNSTGIHLHLDVREGPLDNDSVDPYGIYSTGENYHCFDSSFKSNPNYLWTTTPPDFAESVKKTPEFNIGNSIVMNTDGLNLRENPGTGCQSITTLALGTKGIIKEGPKVSNEYYKSYLWWKIEFDINGTKKLGWVAQSNSGEKWIKKFQEIESNKKVDNHGFFVSSCAKKSDNKIKNKDEENHGSIVRDCAKKIT